MMSSVLAQKISIFAEMMGILVSTINHCNFSVLRTFSIPGTFQTFLQTFTTKQTEWFYYGLTSEKTVSVALRGLMVCSRSPS